jgi:molybdopterin synthase sulfur carrier subunit|tara:strand:- start:535 stop:804 length:270 start_codon:yes stop_codon:yes gene_type:complete
MKIKIELFGAAKDFSDEGYLEIELLKKTNIKELKEKLIELLKDRYPENMNYSKIVETSAFCNENDQIVQENYLISEEQKLCIIPPVGGG